MVRLETKSVCHSVAPNTKGSYYQQQEARCDLSACSRLDLKAPVKIDKCQNLQFPESTGWFIKPTCENLGCKSLSNTIMGETHRERNTQAGVEGCGADRPLTSQNATLIWRRRFCEAVTTSEEDRQGESWSSAYSNIIERDLLDPERNTHIESATWKDTRRTWPSVSQGKAVTAPSQGPQRKPALPMPPHQIST